MSSTYIDLHNLSQIEVDEINVSNLNTDSVITTDLTVLGSLTGLTTSTSSLFNYTYTPSTRTFTLGLANQVGVDYILITDSSGIFQATLFTPLIYPLLSATSPIIYDNTTGIFSLDTTIAQNETFNGLLTATNNTLSTISQSNKVYVTPTSLNTNYFFPMFTTITAGYKDFLCESNTTFFYNPVTDLLTSSNFTGTATMKTNSYQGITTSSAITIGNALNTITLAGSITASTGINIPTGQTYKINSVAQTFLNQLTTTATSTITHTFVSPNLQSNINSLSITNAMLSGSITLSKIVIGTANQFLQTSSTLVNNWVSMSGDSTLTNGILTIANGAVSLAKIASAAYSQLAISVSTLVQRDSAGDINVNRINANQVVLTNSSSGTIDATSVGKYVTITYPSASTELVPYCNSFSKTLIGVTASLTSLYPTWDRVTTTTNTLEVSVYSKGSTALWKIEGQLVNYYVAPGIVCNINVVVFANTASTATITGPSSNIIASYFVNRNFGGALTTYVTPFTCYFSIGGAPYPEGTCFTFTVYVSGETGGNTFCGRSGDDIPSNICVTQLN